MKKAKLGVFAGLSLSAALVTAGCGNSTSTGVNSSADSSGNGQKMTLTFWSHNADKVVPNGYDVTYFQNKFNVNINFQQQDNDTYQQKVNLLISSGKIPDYIRDATFSDFAKYVDQGVVAAIDPKLVEQYMPKYTQWLKQNLGDNPFQYATVNGKLYSLPILWTLGPTSKVVGIRQDWLKNVGIDKTPTTLNELEDALRKFTFNDPDGNGQKDTYGITTAISTSPSSIFSSIFGAFGVYPGAFTVDNGKVVRGEILPGAKDALTLLNKWYKEGLIDPEFVVNKTTNVQDKVLNQKVGIVEDSWYNFIPAAAFYGGTYYDKLVEKNPNAKWATIAGPVGPTGQSGMVQKNPIISSGLQFGKQLENNKDKMIKYMQIFEAYSFDPKAMESVWYGEEGKTFQKTADGGYQYIAPYDTPEEQAKYGFGKSIYELPGSFNDYQLQDPLQTAPKYRDLEQAAQKVGKGQYDILQPITKPIYDQNFDKLDQFTIKTFIDFITGAQPISNFDQYVSKWMSMGGDQVMKEAQQKYDALPKK